MSSHLVTSLIIMYLIVINNVLSVCFRNIFGLSVWFVCLFVVVTESEEVTGMVANAGSYTCTNFNDKTKR